MALTGLLRQAKSPLTLAIKEHMPDLVPVMRAHLSDAVRDLPPGPLASPAVSLHALSMGAAINERLVLGRARRGDVAHSRWQGAATFLFSGNFQQIMLNPDIAAELNALVTQPPGPELPATDPILPADDPERAARLAVLLGFIDAAWRGGFRRLGDTLLGLLHADDLDAALALPEQSWVEDICEVAELSLPRLEEIPGPAVIAPSMSGSYLVDRAEADLIVANTLVDLKALTDPDPLPWAYRQVVMYALLDLDDEYSIEDVAILLARHGVLVRWNLDETLARAGRLTRKQAHDRIRASLHAADRG